DENNSNASVNKSDANQLERDKRLLSLFGSISLVFVLIAVSLFGIMGLLNGWAFSENPSDYIDFGIFVGALVTPLLALASLMLFWRTLRLQMDELKTSSASLKSTANTTAKLLKQEKDLFDLKILHERVEARLNHIKQ